ncbi:MAG: flagellar biosynthesis protein FlhF [Spirochaetes bacterium]|nr:MAG: flagellar biosynthesis protein FlhF [Spirochaetota bacterium]
MQYFTEKARTHREVLEKIRLKYGEKAKILNQKTVRMGGVLGLFGKEGIEMSGYVADEVSRRKQFDLEEEQKKFLSGLKVDKTMQLLLKEVQDLKKKIDVTVSEAKSDKHPSIARIEQIMVQNDFTTPFIEEIIDRVKREFSLDDLENFNMVQHSVIEWIGERISIYREKEKTKPRIFVLVGPTGVGKTTTIAKLAAIYGIGSSKKQPLSVRLLTTDNYRIGAKKQIETYGEIMGIPVASVETYQDLKKKLAMFQEADLILVDTIGKSPKDYMKLAEMRELLDGCGSTAETHLAVSATTKTSDIYEVLGQFEPFKYRSVVLTKLDETMRVGNVISVLYEKKKPLSYITDGQIVPQDIERATVSRMLMNLEGFIIDRARIQSKFEEEDNLSEWR